MKNLEKVIEEDTSLNRKEAILESKRNYINEEVELDEKEIIKFAT